MNGTYLHERRKEMKKILIVLLAMVGLLLVSCSTGYWTKPNFTNEEWKKDYYECDYNTHFYCYPQNEWLCWRANISMCLEARGYEYIQNR